ncbi:unnamed protein product [Mycena citricolor]|uniref:Uncharacterized protein n=1 Tax=Mycena citricolor TaxID=2018698 RepID=A0AAD2HQ41_9AGAR|nr:unnamed protein product [Mycena citricolor]
MGTTPKGKSKKDEYKQRLDAAKAKENEKKAKKALTANKKAKAAAKKADVEKENEIEVGEVGPVVKRKRRSATVIWSKRVYFYVTDLLLTIIEESTRYRQAFGFSTEGNINSKGLTVKDVCIEIAQHLFFAHLLLIDKQKAEHEAAVKRGVSEEDAPVVSSETDAYEISALGAAGRIDGNELLPPFALSDLEDLGTASSCSLKTSFTRNVNKLGSTGYGLIDAGKEAEITEGSSLANVWGKAGSDFLVLCTEGTPEETITGFPWFLRMNELTRTNPTFNRTAVANSSTPVTLDVLSRDKAKEVSDELSNSGTEEPLTDWCSSSPLASPANPLPQYQRFDELTSSSIEDEDTLPENIPATPTPATASGSRTQAKDKCKPVQKETSSSSASSGSSTPRGTKRKGAAGMVDFVQDISSRFTESRLKIVKMQEKTRKEENEQRYDYLLARMAHEQKENEARRQHEMEMMDRQIRLEELRRSAVVPSTFDAYGPGAPAGGAPPPIDPRLLNMM